MARRPSPPLSKTTSSCEGSTPCRRRLCEPHIRACCYARVRVFRRPRRVPVYLLQITRSVRVWKGTWSSTDHITRRPFRNSIFRRPATWPISPAVVQVSCMLLRAATTALTPPLLSLMFRRPASDVRIWAFDISTFRDQGPYVAFQDSIVLRSPSTKEVSTRACKASELGD